MPHPLPPQLQHEVVAVAWEANVGVPGRVLHLMSHVFPLLNTIHLYRVGEHLQLAEHDLLTTGWPPTLKILSPARMSRAASGLARAARGDGCAVYIL